MTEIKNLEIMRNRESLNNTRDKIDSIMKKVGTMKVACPKCGTVQATSSPRERECITCKQQFRIFPQKKPSRIYDCDDMRKVRIWIMHLKGLVNHERSLQITKRCLIRKEKQKIAQWERDKSIYGN